MSTRSMKTAVEAAIDAAHEELQEKDVHVIQRETAFKWAGRACAAKALGLDEDVHEYAHEALEHAALCLDEAVLRTVRKVFEEWGVEP